MVKAETNKKISYFDIIIISMVMFVPELMKYIWTAVNMFTSVVGLKMSTTTITSILWIVIVFVFLRIFVKRLSWKDLLFYLCLVGFISVFFIFPTHGKFTGARYVDFVFKVIPYYFLGRVYRYDESQKKILLSLATITLVLSMFYVYKTIADGDERLEDDMYAAYMILPSVLMLLSSFFDNKNKIFILPAIVAVLFLSSLGTRGPILCAVVFIALMFIKQFKAKKVIALACVGAVMLGTFVSSPYFSKALLGMANGMEKLGLSNRIFVYILDENLDDDTGRSSIKDSLIKNIKEHPLDVNGPYYDWAIVSGDFEKGPKPVEQEGTYAHNFFLEMWAQYGVVLGSIFIICVFLLILRMYKTTEKRSAVVPVVFICATFMKLLLSNTYLQEPSFFFLLGLCVNSSFIGSKMLNKERTEANDKNQIKNVLVEGKE